MPNNYDIAFTHSHEIQDDGSVKFECSRDIEKWPWLTLPPAHPIVVQTINFWASVETGITRGTFDPTKWSALTFAHWETGAEFTGPVIRGLADTPPGEPDIEKPHYRLTFFDAAGNLVCRIVGTGVIFKTRNFEAWRGKAKEKADLSHSIKHFTFAPAESLGVNSDVERFLSPLSHGDRVTAGALVTTENGLMPRHPYHAGSGDHVNANHLLDAAFQFAHLAYERPLTCSAGEVTFRHYVELGRPFRLTQTQKERDVISLTVHQGERECTQMTLWVK